MDRNFYLRRNGGLVFWRVGRIGGSFYLARNPKSQSWIILRTGLTRLCARHRVAPVLGTAKRDQLATAAIDATFDAITSAAALCLATALGLLILS